MNEEVKKCGKKTEVFARVVGFYRPIQVWNYGKRAEFHERKNFTEVEYAIARKSNGVAK